MKVFKKWFTKFFTESGIGIVRSYIGINLESCIPAFIALIVYIYFHDHGLYFKKENTDIVMKILQGLWVVYGFMATQAVLKTVDKYNNITNTLHDFTYYLCEFKKDECPENKKRLSHCKHCFKKIRDQNLPTWFHLVMGHLSAIMVFGNLTIYQEDIVYGKGLVFGSVFLMYFVFRITVSLENPAVGIWKISKLPHGVDE